MTQIGAFPGLRAIHRRTIRAELNPLDKSTVISCFPLEIDEKKHTIQPGEFKLAPGSVEKPSILVVGASSWWREIDAEQPLLEIPVGSVVVAESIVRDYCNGLIGYNSDTMKPALFWLPGTVSVTDLKTKPEFKKHFDAAIQKQNNWYKELVRQGDVLWSRTNGNPLAVSDLMRLAASELGLKSKEWLGYFENIEMVRCIACGNMRNPSFPVCPNCKTIVDPEKAAKLNLKVAQ